MTVTGTVDEFYPDTAPASSVMLSTTELTGATWVEQSSGNALPPAEVAGARLPFPSRIPASRAGSIESFTLAARPVRPRLLRVARGHARAGFRRPRGRARRPRSTSCSSPPSPHENPTVRGGHPLRRLRPAEQRAAPDPVADPVRAAAVPAGRRGRHPRRRHRWAGRLQPLRWVHGAGDQLGAESGGGIQREITRQQRDNELAVATYNVENLDPTDPSDKFARLAQGIVTNLSSPDIVALEEIQDNNGPDQRRHRRRRPDA